MVLSLIYGKKYAQSSINSPDVGIVTFDTMVSEEHKYSSRVTYYPVEVGTIVSDHIIKQPDIVVLSGLVTDTPLTLFAPFNRSISAFNSLIAIFERRQIVNVVTGIKLYRNMAITSLDVPRTVKTGQTLTFNIELQRIIYDNEIQLPSDTGNVFNGVRDNTPRAIVSQGNNIPFIQNDPAYSLQDQASSQVSVGFQSLEFIPTSILPNVLQNLPLIAGVA
jgi:hypothetical protein